MRRLGSAAVAGVIAMLLWGGGSASAAVTPGTATPNVPAPAAITWGGCSDPLLRQDHAQCGYMSVPLDYSNPTGPQIKLAVSRIEHTSSHYQGVILTNPGGPGGSGLDLNTFLTGALNSEGFGAAAADYDWIGFDPRGVGSSKPAISCIPDYFGPDRPNYVPRTAALQDYWLSASQSYAQACEGGSPTQSELLRNMTTRDVAMDMDSIRQALGQAQITYYGFSYGTDLGQVYATMFPSRVRRLIMDSNVNPLRDGYQDFNLDQDAPFNRNANLWFGWIAKWNSVFHLGDNEAAVQDRFYSAEDQLTDHPAGGEIGPDEWNDIFLEVGYYQETWVQWAQAFADWVHGHSSAAADNLISLYQAVDAPGDDNEFAVYLSVLCTDSHWPLNYSQWDSDTTAIYQQTPFDAWDNTWFNAPCIFWPAPSSQQVQVNGSKIKSALLIDQTLDAATPFLGSLVVRKLFPNSVLLAEPGGTTHADSLDGNLCVDGTIAAYLETGALPQRKPSAEWDKTCAPLPQPNPTGSGDGPEAFKPPTEAGGQALRLGLPAVQFR